MKSTRRGSDSPVHRREKTPRFQIPLDKWPVSPGTPREASGVPCFEANRGQTDPRVKFFARGGHFNFFLTDAEAVMAWRKRNSRAALRMRWLGANPAARIEGLDQAMAKANYLTGSEQARWVVNAPSYARVRYNDLYPGIDLIYYGAQGRLEYDLVVKPGADPSAPRLSV